MRSWRAPGGVCVACGGLWAGDPRRCLVQEGWAWRQGGEEALGLERGSDHWVWLLLGVIRERREWGPGGEATPGPGACLSGDWAGGENVWPQTGTERLLYAAPPLVTEHHPPRARTPAGGEGGHPSGAGCVEGSSAGGACDGRGQWAPRPAPIPLLGTPWASAQSSALPAAACGLAGTPRGLGKGHTCSSRLSPRTCLTCPGRARELSHAECPRRQGRWGSWGAGEAGAELVAWGRVCLAHRSGHPRAGARRSAGQPSPLCHGALRSTNAGRSLGQSC